MSTGQLVLFAPKPDQEMEGQRVREVQRINSQVKICFSFSLSGDADSFIAFFFASLFGWLYVVWCTEREQSGENGLWYLHCCRYRQRRLFFVNMFSYNINVIKYEIWMMCWSNWYQHNCKFITDLYCICWLGWLKSERWFCQAAKEDALKIWNLLRVIRAQSSLSGSGRPRLLLQHEILPLEAQRVRLPLNLANKRSKEVVYPVRQRQSNQQTAFARQALNQHKASPINRVQMEKRFSGFRDLQRMNQLAKREEHTQALERPGNTITHWPRKEIDKYL